MLLIHWDDPRYPPPLKGICDAPPVLYVKGTLERGDCLALAIVGSRRCTHYGSEQTEALPHLLAAAGITIVSGLGASHAAHRGALAATGSNACRTGLRPGALLPS